MQREGLGVGGYVGDYCTLLESVRGTVCRVVGDLTMRVIGVIANVE